MAGLPGGQCFSTSNGDGPLPRVGLLELGKENARNATTSGGDGNTGGNIGPNSAFDAALIGAGFSPEDVAKIEATLADCGLVVVATNSALG